MRMRLEHTFGHQVYRMKAHVVRTIGIMRACFQIGLENFDYNLIRRFKNLSERGNRNYPRRMPLLSWKLNLLHFA